MLYQSSQAVGTLTAAHNNRTLDKLLKKVTTNLEAKKDKQTRRQKKGASGGNPF